MKILVIFLLSFFVFSQESIKGLQQQQYDSDNSSLKVQRSNYIQSNVHMNTNKIPYIVQNHMKKQGRTLIVQGQKKTYKNSSLKRELQGNSQLSQSQIQAIANKAIQQNLQSVKNLQTQSSGFIAPMKTNQSSPSDVQKSAFDVVPKIIYDKVASQDIPQKQIKRKKKNRNRKLNSGSGFTGWGEFPYSGATPTNSMFAPQQSFNYHTSNRLVPDYVENRIRQSRDEEVGSFYDDPQVHNLEGRKELVNYQDALNVLNDTNEMIDKVVTEMKNLEITKNQIMSKLNGRVEQLRDLVKNSKVFNIQINFNFNNLLMEIDEFIAKEKLFFQKEKQIEDKEYEDLYINKDFNILVDKGFILTNMNLFKIKQIFHKKILLCLSVSKNIQNRNFQDNLKITSNDNIIILPQKNILDLKTSQNHGTVYKITKDQIQILIEEDLNQIEEDKNYMILKTSDNVTYDRIRLLFKDLEKYKQNEFKNKQLVIKTLRQEDQKNMNDYTSYSNVKLQFDDNRLNEIQQNAVKQIMAMKDIFLIHGPPGTGKTKTLAEVCKQLIKKGKKIIICSPSNTGVDNLLSIISQQNNTKILRIGNPGRVKQNLQEYVLDNQIKIYLKKDTNFRKQKTQLKSIQQKLHKSNTKKSDLKNLKDERKSLYQSIKEYENVVIEQIFSSSQIIGATLAGIFDKKFQSYIFNKGNRKFYDYTIIDEAGQALRSLSFMGIIQSEKLIMAGDHQQLPPTIKQKNIKNYQTLFEQLIKKNYPQIMLNLQYRMNSKIMQISSDFLYNKKLKLGNTLQNKLIQGEQDNFFSEQISPLIFINTSQSMFGEEAIDQNQNREFSQSKVNIGESFLVLNIFLIFNLDYKINSEQIGIITPYSAQVEYISKQLQILKEQNIVNDIPEVKTVDGFQGREKEIIIISCVRSNQQKEYGFLRDIRRMNVAITRAKKVLCLIGDENTIGQEKFTGYIIDQIKQKGQEIQCIEFDGFQRDGYQFMYQQYFQSGVFNKVQNKQENKKNKKKKKKKKKQKQEQNNTNFNDVIDTEQNLQQYFKEILDQFLQDDQRSYQILYKKYNDLEYNVLHQLVQQNDIIQIEKQKTKILLTKKKEIQSQNIQENDVNKTDKEIQNNQTQTEDENILQNQNNNTEQFNDIIQNQDIVQKKKKKKKKKKNKNLTLEQQEDANLKYIEELDKQNELKRKKCSREDSKGKWCNKIITLNYLDCNFCNQRFCVKHVLAENHGCGDAAKQRERNKLFYHNKNPYEKQDERNVAYLERKLKKQLKEKQEERKPKKKNKKKKKK